MKNVKNFNEFLNEGVFSKKDDMDELLDSIYDDINLNLNKNNIETYLEKLHDGKWLLYTTSKNDNIYCVYQTKFNIDNKYSNIISINKDEIYDKKCIKITKLLHKKYKELEEKLEKEIINKQKTEILTKYKNKYK